VVAEDGKTVVGFAHFTTRGTATHRGLSGLVGEHVHQNSLCKTLRLTPAFSRVSGPAMPTRKICNSRVLISASMRCRVWDTPL
jgi:hypothetical protein